MHSQANITSAQGVAGKDPCTPPISEKGKERMGIFQVGRVEVYTSYLFGVDETDAGDVGGPDIP